MAIDVNIDKLGYVVINDVLDERLCSDVIDRLPVVGGAGDRTLLSHEWCIDLAARLKTKLSLNVPEIKNLTVVQCTLFQKSAKTNWLVSWHQDRSIPVTSNNTHTATVNRVKAAINFTQPSYNSMKNVLAVRLHLDNNTLKNGPLNVLAGTHELGILKAEELTALNKQSAITVTGARGSVMVMRPLLVHASSKALQPDNRRVLHFLYV